MTLADKVLDVAEDRHVAKTLLIVRLEVVLTLQMPPDVVTVTLPICKSFLYNDDPGNDGWYPGDDGWYPKDGGTSELLAGLPQD